MRHKISISVTKIFRNFPGDWNCLVIVHDLLSAHFDNCLPPCFIPLPPVLEGNALMFLFIIAFRLLKGSGLFTHFWFLASSIEHILFTLNKYVIERRIISNFSISTDTWTLTFLRALIRQVYEGGECCLEIACSPAFECETLVCVCGLAQACPALLR